VTAMANIRSQPPLQRERMNIDSAGISEPGQAKSSLNKPRDTFSSADLLWNTVLIDPIRAYHRLAGCLFIVWYC